MMYCLMHYVQKSQLKKKKLKNYNQKAEKHPNNAKIVSCN